MSSNIDNNQTNNKKTILIIVGVCTFVVIAVILYFVLFTGGVKPKYDNNDKPIYVSSENLNDYYSSPGKYLGLFLDLNVMVDSKKTIENKTYLLVYTNIDNRKDEVVIEYDGNLDVKEKDYLKITGYILGINKDSNLFILGYNCPIIKATNVEKSTYLETSRPALKTVEYSDKIIDQKGYKIQVTKVEFAKDETRIYLKAFNNAKADFSIYTYSTIITQNGKQYEDQDNYNYDYEKLNNNLKPGIKSEGILTFPAIKQEDFDFILTGHSSDWNIDLKEYKFNLEIK